MPSKYTGPTPYDLNKNLQDCKLCFEDQIAQEQFISFNCNPEKNFVCSYKSIGLTLFLLFVFVMLIVILVYVVNLDKERRNPFNYGIW